MRNASWLFLASVLTVGPINYVAAQPAVAPAPKVEFPVKGRSISFIVPFAPGGSMDISSRVLTAGMEKELGVPIQISNMTGGGGQIGLTSLSRAKPDGYTIGCIDLIGGMASYLDPDRKAAYSRKSFQPISNQWVLNQFITVAATGPYKTVSDLVDAHKAKPGTLRRGDPGYMSTGHLNGIALAKALGIQVRTVHFNSGAETLNAMMGGNVDFSVEGTGGVMSSYKNGNVRLLATMADEVDNALPEAKPLKSFGFKSLYFPPMGGTIAPAGTPKAIVDILANAIRKTLDNPDYKKRMTDLGYNERYLAPDQYAVVWAEMESQIVPLMESAKAP